MTTEIEILATIKRFKGVPLTVDELFKVARLEDDNSQKALVKLISKNFVYRHKGEFHLSEPGEDYLEKMGLYSEKIRSLKRWKDEALTGMIETRSRLTHRMVSAPSKLDKAVLSTATMEAPEGVRPDNILIEMENLRIERLVLCKQLEITMEEYKKLLQDGRIRICKGAGLEHVGIFDKKGLGRWHEVCRVCRKQKRRNKNKV
jgi:predicted transcriptional regulator